MEIIKNKRILALIGIICLIVGTFLPYFTFTLWGYSQSISLWGYWEGKIVLVLTLANALFIFQEWLEKYVPSILNNGIGRLVKKANNPKFSLIPTILVAGFAIYMLVSIDVSSEYLKYGLGFYTLWLGIIALVGHAIFYKGQNQVQQPIQQTIPQQNVAIDNQNVKHCPRCGNKVDANSPICTMCGNNF